MLELGLCHLEPHYYVCVNIHKPLSPFLAESRPVNLSTSRIARSIKRTNCKYRSNTHLLLHILPLLSRFLAKVSKKMRCIYVRHVSGEDIRESLSATVMS